MTFDALEHRDVAQVDWMLELLIGLVAKLALVFVRQPTEIDWVDERASLHILFRRRG